MIIVGIVAQKGGVGKSTFARLLAVNYAKAGWDVKICDMDISQGTSLSWNSRRMQNEFEPYVAVEQFPTISQALKKSSEYDMVIFDGAPHATKQTLEIAKHSDLIVIPTGTSVDDLEPTILLAHELKAKGIDINKLGIAFSRIGNSETELIEAQEYVTRAGYQLFEGVVYEKTAIRRAQDIGKCATETNFKSVNNTIDGIVESIVNKINVLTN